MGVEGRDELNEALTNRRGRVRRSRIGNEAYVHNLRGLEVKILRPTRARG